MADTAKTTTANQADDKKTAGAKQTTDDKNLGQNNSDFGTGEGQTNANASKKQLEKADIDTSEAEAIEKMDPVPVFNLHAGLTPRLGGPYLDVVQLEQAEIRRAAVEKREPDFTDLSAGCAGVPLVTADQLVQAHANSSVNSVLSELVLKNKDDENAGPNPLGEVPAVGNPLTVAAQDDERKPLMDHKDVFSHDNPDVHFNGAVFNQ